MSKKEEVLEKGIGKILSTAALAGTMALGQGKMEGQGQSLSPKNPKPVFSATELRPEKDFDKNALQQAMAQVESNNGQNTQHDLLNAGPDAGTHAKGHYGLTNSTIKDIIRTSPKFMSSHKDVLDYNDDQIHDLIYNQQPYLQHHLASQQIDNISRTLKSKKPEHVAYAWLHGITGAQKAIDRKEDIANHWHVKKVMDAYNNIINKQMKKSNKDIVNLLSKKDKALEQTAIDHDIQNALSEHWKKARKEMYLDTIDDTSKPNPLDGWNKDLEDLKNSDANLYIINLIKSKI